MTDQPDSHPRPDAGPWRGTPPPPADDPQRLDLGDAGFMPEPVRTAMLDWFSRHGINADEVPIPSIVERQPRERRIVHEVYLLNDAGGRYVDATGEDAARMVAIVQLDREPGPFPDVVLDHDRALREHRDQVASAQRLLDRLQAALPGSAAADPGPHTGGAA